MKWRILIILTFNCFIFCQINTKERLNLNYTNFTEDSEYLYYFYINYLSPEPIESFIPIILNHFEEKNNKSMIAIFNEAEKYTKFFYNTVLPIYYKNEINTLLKNYTLGFFDKNNLMLHVKINPCINRTHYCCEKLGQCLSEKLEIEGKKDIEIAYICNNFLPLCGGNFSDLCGTFFEIHMPSNPKVLSEKKINIEFSSGYRTLFLSTKSLCTGKYELWLVIRMRGINTILYIKPFQVLYSTCTCEEIKNHGYLC